ncbi:MAG TPA: hypothetical protein VGE21_11650 [Flavobacteriales bacterium]
MGRLIPPTCCMMFNGRACLSILFLSCLSLLFSCKKDNDTSEPALPPTDDGAGTGGTTGEPPSPGESRIRFWSRMRMFDHTYSYLEFDGHHVLFDDVNNTTPSNCSSGDQTFIVDPGTYSYHLYNSSMDIEWDGTVVVGQDQCKLVEIVEPPGCWGKGKLLVYASFLIGDMEIKINGITTGAVLDEEFSNAPPMYTEGTYSRYADPGVYQLRAYDGNGPDGGELIGTLNFSLQAGQQTTLVVEE